MNLGSNLIKEYSTTVHGNKQNQNSFTLTKCNRNKSLWTKLNFHCCLAKIPGLYWRLHSSLEPRSVITSPNTLFLICTDVTAHHRTKLIYRGACVPDTHLLFSKTKYSWKNGNCCQLLVKSLSTSLVTCNNRLLLSHLCFSILFCFCPR